MVLHHAPRSPFALKVRVCLAELQIEDQVELVAVDPWTDDDLRQLNPLCQVPTLVAPDGDVLFGSSLIVHFLNDAVSGGLIPEKPTMWRALKREAMADGLTSATIRRFVERQDAASDRSRRIILRQEAAIAAVLDDATRDRDLDSSQIDVGHAALVAAISYLDRRSPEIDWRSGRTRLSRWYDRFLTRPSAGCLRSA